jgi:hypothetical protein
MEQKEVHNHLPKSHSELPFVILCLCVFVPLVDIHCFMPTFTIALQKAALSFPNETAIQFNFSISIMISKFKLR